MKPVIIYIFFGLILSALSSTGIAQTTTVFLNATLIPMDSDRVQPGMDVMVEGGRIVSIKPHGSETAPAGALIIDASGKYILPGLAEMHGHVPPTQGGNLPARYVEDVLFLYLAGGITTVRGMLGYPNQLDLKKRINRGELIGPNLYLAGPSFSGNTVNSPDEATNRVKQQAAEGWDLLKIHPGLTLDEYTAMAKTANELGIPFAGHIPEEVGLENAIKLGQQTIDHLDGYMAFANGMNAPVNETKLNEAIAMSKEYDVWVVPTQALWETLIGAAKQEELKAFDEVKYMPKAVIAGWDNYLNNISNSYLHSGTFARLHASNRDKLLKGLQDAGVKILMGTDAPQVYSVPGFSIHRELKAMSKAGLSNFQILTSGTSNVGEYFKQQDSFGMIAPGQRADLLMVSGNPLLNLEYLRSLDGVMVNGKWMSKSFIEQRLSEIEAAYRE
jgi:imidazolonepropionase-like amidohydrolase